MTPDKTGTARTQSDSDKQASQAWDAYKAIVLRQQQEPGLAENPYWLFIRAEAYANFCLAFEATQ